MTIPATFDERTQINEILREYNVSISAFTRLQHETTLNRWTVERLLNGERLGQYETSSLLKLAHELKALQDSFADSFGPLPLDWNDTNSIRACLARRREQDRERASRQ
jgi:hypothetical protein